MELDFPFTQFTGPGAQVSGFCILTAVPMSPELVGSYFHLPERKPHPLATAADDPQPIPRKPLIYSVSTDLPILGILDPQNHGLCSPCERFPSLGTLFSRRNHVVASYQNFLSFRCPII